MSSEETERICFNCAFYFPASQEMTEYGICLEDNVFEPYIPDLLENLNFTVCEDLIEQKKFLGERDACEKFEEAEMLEVPDDSPLGEAINHFNETGEIDQENIVEAIFEQFNYFDAKSFSVEPLIKKLESSDKEEYKKTLRILGSLAAQGNREAFEVLFSHLKALPVPEKIEDVHIKIDILEGLRYEDGPDQRSRLIPLLIEELSKVASNNTTRQWINKILQYLTRAPEEDVRQPLEDLLKERKFSVRTRQKIEAILEKQGKEDYFHREWW